MSWLNGDLILAWTDKAKMEAHPAVAEVRFRVHQRPWEPWEHVRQILSRTFRGGFSHLSVSLTSWVLFFFVVVLFAENGQHQLQQFQM